MGLLFVVGLLLGAVHNTMTATSIRKATNAGGEPDKRAFAFSSLFRLLYVTVFAAIFLVVFHRAGLAVFIGLLVFHFLALVGTGGAADQGAQEGMSLHSIVVASAITVGDHPTFKLFGLTFTATRWSQRVSPARSS